MFREGDVVVVVGVLSDEASDTDLTEVVEEAAELVGGAVEVIGRVVEHGQHEVVAALPVAPLAVVSPTSVAGSMTVDDGRPPSWP